MNTLDLVLRVKLSEGVGINEAKKMIAHVLHRHKDAAGIEFAKVSRPMQNKPVSTLKDNIISIAKAS